MSLFKIADLHLSLSTDKSMEIFKGWENYTEKIEKNWNDTVSDSDTVVIPGDISWAMKLEQAEADLRFIHNLPGKKLIFKGNHDLWWQTMSKLNIFLQDNGFDSIEFLHNSAKRVGDIAVCGTRGWFYDGEASKKVILREAGRLEASIKSAIALGGEPVAFLHYPPIAGDLVVDEIMQVLLDYKIKRCYYGHIHGVSFKSRRAFEGDYKGIEFKLISADYLKFMPFRVN